MRATTKAVKKKAVKSLPRETSMSKSDKENSIDEMRQGMRHRRYVRESFNLFAHHLKAERKKTRELKREVTRLNALVVKLAEKI